MPSTSNQKAGLVISIKDLDPSVSGLSHAGLATGHAGLFTGHGVVVMRAARMGGLRTVLRATRFPSRVGVWRFLTDCLVAVRRKDRKFLAGAAY